MHLHDLKSFLLKKLLISSIGRVIAGPIVGFLLIRYFNLTGFAAGVLLIQCSMPSAVLNYLVASIYSPKKIIDSVASTIVVSTLMSFITIPIVVFFALKYFQLNSINWLMKAIIFSLLGWMFLPVMDGFAKYLSDDLPILQITWARYFFTVAFVFPIMFFFYKKQLVWSDKPKIQIFRGLILLSANICFFYAISVISLAKALTLAFIAPLIVTAFSPILLGEKVGYRRWTAVAVGFIGSLIVIRPGFLEFNLASMAALATGSFMDFILLLLVN